jgi:serine/threonine protein kinase
MARNTEIRAMISALGKYEIMAENHEGMNAYSFRARHIPLNVEVFLKAWDVDPASDDLYSEARLLNEISESDHGKMNLVRVLDAQRLDNETVLMAMEFVEDGSLLSQLRERGPFALADALRIVIGILHGLARMHSRQLVHRDLKPANIMIERADLWPKIGDFGSVAHMDSDGIATRKSRRSALYTPPECWRDPPAYTRASDMYQVGVTAHELINGPLPYRYDSYLDAQAMRDVAKAAATTISDVSDPVERDNIINRAIARRAVRRKLLDLSPTLDYVPDAVRRVIRRATSPQPNARYPSLTEFIAALEQIDCPNWFVDGDELHALDFRGADWLIKPLRTGFVARRRFSSGYRQWKTSTNLSPLIAAVNDA